ALRDRRHDGRTRARCPRGWRRSGFGRYRHHAQQRSGTPGPRMVGGDTMNRYARQMILPGVGADGQARLSGARILIVGARGLGVPALLYPAAAGVGHITLADPDVVAEHNLHRQPLYRMADTGRLKAVAAAEAL